MRIMRQNGEDMENVYKVLMEPCEGQIEEKKSKFIANAFPVTTLQDVEERIAQITKKHYDAKHHCYALVLGDNFEMKRSSDNGEPQGTAGKPILNVIEGSGITNIIIIVTRYFGGTLLGTGGLVRAYTAAAKEALMAAEIGTVTYSRKITLETSYDQINPIQYYLVQHQIALDESRYGSEVEMDITIADDTADEIINALRQKTNGNIKIHENEIGYFILK